MITVHCGISNNEKTLLIQPQDFPPEGEIGGRKLIRTIVIEAEYQAVIFVELVKA